MPPRIKDTMGSALETTQFRGKTLAEWLDELEIDVYSFMLTKNEWDPVSLQAFGTAVASRLNKAYRCRSEAKGDHSATRRTNRRKFNELLEQAVQRTGSRAQVTALKAGVESRMAQEMDDEAVLEAIKEFWDDQVARMERMSESARQLGYLQNQRSRME